MQNDSKNKQQTRVKNMFNIIFFSINNSSEGVLFDQFTATIVEELSIRVVLYRIYIISIFPIENEENGHGRQKEAYEFSNKEKYKCEKARGVEIIVAFY